MPAAKDRVDALEAVLDQNLRRTGAGFFIRSGTVGDDPLVGIQLVEPVRQVVQLDIDCPGDMTGPVGFWDAHIDKDRRLAVKGGTVSATVI